MITMYAAAANRTGEIGTLRAIGFRKSAVMMAFLAESQFLALLGGVAGLAMASLMQRTCCVLFRVTHRLSRSAIRPLSITTCR